MLRRDLDRAQVIGFRVHGERYEIALLGLDDEVMGAFAMIEYGGERTFVRGLREGERAFEGRNYRMISFVGELPLDTVGFLAMVSGALAALEIPIFVVSSYRTDHILILEKDLENAIEALGSLGMIQRR